MAFHALHKGGPQRLGDPGPDSYPQGVPRPDMDIHSSAHTRGATYTSSVIVGKPNKPLYNRFVCGSIAEGDIVSLLTLSVFRTLLGITIINRLPLEGLVLDLVQIPLLLPVEEEYKYDPECDLLYCEPLCDYGVADFENAVDLIADFDMGAPLPLIEAGDPWIAESLGNYYPAPMAMESATSLIGVRVKALPADLRGGECVDEKNFRFDMHMCWIDHCLRTPTAETEDYC